MTDGAREAFRDGQGGVSYAEAEERAGRIAAALHDAGVKRGDRVIVYMARGVCFKWRPTMRRCGRLDRRWSRPCWSEPI